jgi:hypothetical protein
MKTSGMKIDCEMVGEMNRNKFNSNLLEQTWVAQLQQSKYQPAYTIQPHLGCHDKY